MLAPPRPSWLLPLLFVLPIACSSAVDYELGDGGVDSGPEIVDLVDHDGMDDNWEREHGLDPNADDSNGDLDGDGLTNKQEHDRGTLPDDVDSDDDGLADGAEDANKNGALDDGETDPTKADTDGDGLQDGLERGRTSPLPPREGIAGTSTVAPNAFTPDQDPGTQTTATNADSDSDGIPDGVEDLNQNGRVDEGESDPMSADTDNDGVPDGEEDANHNGKQDDGETGATNADSDGDGVPDGVELGKTTPVADPDGDGPATGTDPTKFVPDADPSTTTKADNPDSDGDGVSDGDEDLNQNGRVDEGELDPNKTTTAGGVPDASSGTALVCTNDNIPNATLYRLASADLTLALPSDRTGDNNNLNVIEAVVPLKVPNADASSGLIFRDEGGRVGFAITTAAQTAAEVRTKINGVLGLTQEQNRALVTWDSFPARLSAANGQRTAAANPNNTALQIAQAVSGQSDLGVGLPDDGAPSAYFELHYEVIQRSASQTVVAVALRSTSGVVSYNTDDTPKLIDLVNTSVGRFGDGLDLRCDPLTTPPGNDVIDILWVVDNSGSMGYEQDAVSAAATAMVDFLRTTSLDWRLGLTSTDLGVDQNRALHPTPTPRDGITMADDEMQNGFTPRNDAANWANSVVGLGIGAHYDEHGLQMGLTALNTAGVAAAGVVDPQKLRSGASVMVVHMTDEEDFDVKRASLSNNGGGDRTCPETQSKFDRISEFVGGYQEFLADNSSLAGLTTFAITGVEPNPDWENSTEFPLLNRNGVYNPCGPEYSGSGDCSQTSQYARGYVDVATAMGGGSSSICGNMDEAVREIMRSGAGIASTFILSQQPVSSTLRVVVADQNGNFLDGAGEVLADTPRSRTNGFDYAFEYDPTNTANPLKHKIVFYGTERPEPDRLIMIGYRTWEPGERAEDGTVPCDCPEGQICHPDTGVCEVDPTCGSACEADACDQDTGLCQDACGGQCVDNYTCLDNGTCQYVDPCGCTGRAWCDTSVSPPECRGGEGD